MTLREEIFHHLRNQLSKLLVNSEVLRLGKGEQEARIADKLRAIVQAMDADLRALEGLFDDPSEISAIESTSPAAGRVVIGPSTVTGEATGEEAGVGPGAASEELPSTRPEQPDRGRGDARPASTTLESPVDPAELAGRSRSGAVSTRGVPDGTVIGSIYRVIRKLGSGGMGTVMLARDIQLGRLVAIKLVEHDRYKRADAREAFLREARAMARVHHPNVVSIYAFGDHDGAPYFVMEFVPGPSLERLLSVRERRLSFDRAINVIDQACRGLEAIHRAGALHCDVKPANVLLGHASRVAVADLGLARAVGEGPELTGGTPGFVAPEVLRDPRGQVTETADVYAMGSLSFELLSGTMAFGDGDVETTMQRQLDGVHGKASASGEVPEVFDAILDRALSLDPTERHPSVEAFRREMMAACDSLARTYRNTRVFVVDDDSELVAHTSELVRRSLPESTVVGFSDARRALRQAEEAPPTIAIVDLDMPDINGVELTAALKAGREGSKIQVLMVTGVGSARDWEVLQSLGASGFLIKPVDESELAALLRQLAVADVVSPEA